MDVPIAANVLGTMGAVFWSIQLIPQIIINYRRHNTTGLQPSMMMLWAWAGVPLGVYNIVGDFNVALKIQPQALTFLSLLTWIQCYYYEKHWSVVKSLAVIVPIASLMAGTQIALIYALRIARSRNIEWPIILMAVLSAALLAAGVLRHYWDIYIHRTVRGISFIFVGLDAMGDLTSLISVLFQPHLDILGMVIYGTELTLWLGIFACGGYYNLVPWLRKRLGKSTFGTSSHVDTPNVTFTFERHHEQMAPVDAIQLHDLPSSTSVFRTPSAEIALRRTRSHGSARSAREVSSLRNV